MCVIFWGSAVEEQKVIVCSVRLRGFQSHAWKSYSPEPKTQGAKSPLDGFKEFFS
jgi:hypothetical protein